MWASAGGARHQELAARLLAWAAEEPPDEDELSPADLLVGAGEQLALGDDHAGALDAFQAAADRPERTHPDARGFVVRALVDLGRIAEAQDVSEQLRRSRPEHAVTYAYVGEVWEEAGELDRAHRWFTRGLLLAERTRDHTSYALLLISRLRVRESLGFPPDRDDEIAAAMIRESLARSAAADERRDTPRAVISNSAEHTTIDLF